MQLNYVNAESIIAMQWASARMEKEHSGGGRVFFHYIYTCPSRIMVFQDFDFSSHLARILSAFRRMGCCSLTSV